MLLNRLSLRAKLVGVAVASSAVTLGLAGAILVAYENFAYRAQVRQQYDTQAGILSSSVSAALLFADAEAIRESLAALAANPGIAAAAVHDTSGARVAQYLREGVSAQVLPERIEPGGQQVQGGRLVVSRAVTIDDRTIGAVLLSADIESVGVRAARYGGVIVLVMLGSLLLTLPLSMWLSSAISGPVRRMADAALRVSEGDLTVRLDAPGVRDEVGVLMSTFSTMVESLRALNREVRDGVDVLGSSVSQIVTSAGNVSSDADETARAVQATSATVEQAREMARAASEEAYRMSETARSAADVSAQGRQAVEQSVAGIERARAQMEEITARVVELAEQTAKIMQIIETADDLAGQSNVLAVNAAIEAAKAGDQGSSFAVVAHEIRALSEQSRRATIQVRSILKEIHGALAATVAAAEQGTISVQDSAKDSTAAGDAIRALAESVARAAGVAERIADSSKQQAQSMEQAARAMAGIRDATERNVSGARHTEAAARAIEELGRKLGLLVARYRG